MGSNPPFFPVLTSHHRPRQWMIATVPWAMVAHREDRAMANHGQTLRRLAERGGLDPYELILLLDDKPPEFPMLRGTIQEYAVDLAMRVDKFLGFTT